jgi:UDP-glucose 4-epimerase
MNKNYLITGGAGFVGSHLAEALLAGGAEVTIIDDLSTGSVANISHLMERDTFHVVFESVTNATVTDRLISEADMVFHLAAAVGVELIVDDPVRTIETNILGTQVVLRAAARYRTRLLITSTSEIYGKSDQIPFTEEADRVLGPTTKSRWSYAESKAIDEFMALAYHKTWDLPVTIVRLFNTVGPRQTGKYGMVVPRFVQQALQDQPITVYGDGSQSRCFCNVKDVVRALILLADAPDADGEVFNIGSTDEVTILELAQRVLALTGGGTERIQFIPYDEAYEPGFEDMQRRVPSIAKIGQLVGWAPRLSLDETLKQVIAYDGG